MKNKNADGYRSESFNKGVDALKKIGLLLLSFAVIFGVFRLIIALSLRFEAAWIYYIGVTVYALAAVVAVVGFFVLNGFTFSKDGRGEDELPDGWTDEKRADFLKKQPKNRARAKKLIYVILPLALTMAYSYIELFILK